MPFAHDPVTTSSYSLHGFDGHACLTCTSFHILFLLFCLSFAAAVALPADALHMLPQPQPGPPERTLFCYGSQLPANLIQCNDPDPRVADDYHRLFLPNHLLPFMNTDPLEQLTQNKSAPTGR